MQPVRLPSLALLLCAVFGGCGAPAIAFPPDGGSWPVALVPAWSHRARLAITDDGEDTLALVSTDPMPALLGFAPVGDIPLQIEGPHHLVASPDGRFLYVNLSNYAPGASSGPSGAVAVGRDPGKLQKIDAANYQLVAEAQVDRDPGDSVLSSDGKTAWVSHYDLIKFQDALARGLPAAAGYSTVATVDTASMSVAALDPLCVTAHGIALSSDEKTLYVACSLADQIAVMDLATRAVRRVPVGPAAGPAGQPVYFPYALARSPSDGTIWISCNGAAGPEGWPGLRVYDPKTGAMDDARAVPLQGVPMFADWLPDGTTLLVPQQGIEKLSFVDTRTSKELRGINLPAPSCLNSHMIKVSSDGATGWLSCEGDRIERRGSLVTLDLAAQAVLGFVSVGLYADGLAFVPAAP